MRRLTTTDADFTRVLTELTRLRHDPSAAPEVVDRVREILGQVARAGDAALLQWTRALDRWEPRDAQALLVTDSQRSAALDAVGSDVRRDLELAAQRIRRFHVRQRELAWSFETEDGVRLGQRVIPLAAVGVYVPGGTAAYPSSVLMNVVPARVAGVGEIVMVTPSPDGRLSDVVVAAAAIAGVDVIVRVGGAQAIGALARGTETVPRVDKIVGPGNAWVAEAKRQVFGQVAIDMIAGPSEVVIVATRDGGASPEALAADLLAQAEHDARAMATLLSPDAALLEAVAASVAEQLERLPRRAIAGAALRDFGLLIHTRDVDDAMRIAELLAPEHLEIVTPDAEARAETVRNAGAIFVGPHSPEALGDYVLGPNHVLPTNGTARFSSPLGVTDFVKRTNILRVSRAGLEALGPVAVRLARLEGLTAHAESVSVRLPRET